MLRGNAPAKIDDKGRLKVPNAFRAVIHEEHGREVFVTSLTGESVRIYPMPVWLEIERKLAQAPSTHPARLKFLDRGNFYGHPSAEVLARLRAARVEIFRTDQHGQIDLTSDGRVVEIATHTGRRWKAGAR